MFDRSRSVLGRAWGWWHTYLDGGVAFDFQLCGAHLRRQLRPCRDLRLPATFRGVWALAHQKWRMCVRLFLFVCLYLLVLLPVLVCAVM